MNERVNNGYKALKYWIARNSIGSHRQMRTCVHCWITYVSVIRSIPSSLRASTVSALCILCHFTAMLCEPFVVAGCTCNFNFLKLKSLLVENYSMRNSLSCFEIILFVLFPLCVFMCACGGINFESKAIILYTLLLSGLLGVDCCCNKNQLADSNEVWNYCCKVALTGSDVGRRACVYGKCSMKRSKYTSIKGVSIVVHICFSNLTRKQ